MFYIVIKYLQKLIMYLAQRNFSMKYIFYRLTFLIITQQIVESKTIIKN